MNFVAALLIVLAPVQPHPNPDVEQLCQHFWFAQNHAGLCIQYT